MDKKEIDIAPTWMGLFPVFEEFIMNGNKKQRQNAVEHLRDASEKLDKINARLREEKKGKRGEDE